ncbi:MAG: 2OG-Fe(II) oxygenase [Hyphomicrobiales bacterium]|nr:2OG-Fe(II) oxygenase [Hyphomicrobiales bacterium]
MDTPCSFEHHKADLYGRLLPVDATCDNAVQLSERYRSAEPFPHICIDDMFDPDVLERVRAEWPTREQRDWLTWDTKNELKHTSRGIQGLSTFTQTFLLQLCSPQFIDYVKTLTGHDNLLPDPLFYGAGLMETYRGGWLEIHGDFTRHPLLPFCRRINLLIYLNRDWDPDWHGELELWDPVTMTRAASFAPYFNRTVIFDTTTDALHGHPVALACPAERSRQVISVYYWSATDEDLERARPINWVRTRMPPARAILRGCVPPIIYDLRDCLLRVRKPDNTRRWFPRSTAAWVTAKELERK